MPIVESADIVPAQKVRVALYGRAGSGKTVLAATAPDPLVLSCEAGVLSLGKPNLRKIWGQTELEYKASVPVWEINSMDELRDAYRWAMQSTEAGQYRTLFFDSLTMMCQWRLEEESQREAHGQAAYGKMATAMTALLWQMQRFARHHVVCSTQLDHEQDAVTGATYETTLLPGRQLARQLPYIFDEVWCLCVGPDGARYMQTALDHQRIAKDRSGRLDPAEPAHLGLAFAKILTQQED